MRKQHARIIANVSAGRNAPSKAREPFAKRNPQGAPVGARSQETGRVLPNGEREIKVSFKPQVTPKMKDGSVMTELKVPLEAVSSLGAQKAYNLAADIFEVLETGTVLALDELDSRLHPLLTREIIKMFNGRELNPRNAQLVFNTHDTNLLSVKTYDSAKDKKTYLLRRDEICFVEKNSACSRVYSLIDFKKGGCRSVRKDASYELVITRSVWSKKQGNLSKPVGVVISRRFISSGWCLTRTIFRIPISTMRFLRSPRKIRSSRRVNARIGYHKNDPMIFDLLYARMDYALVRSERAFARWDPSTPPHLCNPASQVFELVKFLRLYS